MKKVINGRLYNTDTAKCIGSWDNGMYKSDFSYFAETLYQTRSGAYFLHGEGHANSRYGVWHGNSGGWGEKIMPMSPQEARQWAEENLDAEDYLEAFGEVEEAGDNRVPLNLTVSAEFKQRMIKLREETGKSISQIIEEKLKERKEQC